MTSRPATGLEPRRVFIQGQLAIAWKFAEELVVDKIDPELAMWEPSNHVCTVHHRGGRWFADWPDESRSPIPDVTIAWILWHIEWWWADTASRVMGTGPVEPEQHTWSGDTTGIVAAKHRWDAILERHDLEAMVRWHMPEPQPLWFIAGWVNFELTKNLAEINQLKGLRANS